MPGDTYEVKARIDLGAEKLSQELNNLSAVVHKAGEAIKGLTNLAIQQVEAVKQMGAAIESTVASTAKLTTASNKVKEVNDKVIGSIRERAAALLKESSATDISIVKMAKLREELSSLKSDYRKAAAGGSELNDVFEKIVQTQSNLTGTAKKVNGELKTTRNEAIKVAQEYKYADAACEYYNKTLEKQRLEQQKLAEKLRAYSKELVKASESEKLSSKEAFLLKTRLRELTSQFNKLSRAGVNVEDIKRNLDTTRYNLTVLNKELEATRKKQIEAGLSYKYADAECRYYNKTLERQRLEQQKLAEKLKIYTEGLLRASRSETLTGKQAFLLKERLRELTSQVNKLSRAGVEVGDIKRGLREAKYNLANFSGEVEKGSRTTKKFVGWWKRFAEVALGFTIAYRAINAIEMGIQKLAEMIREGIQLSGELASIQARMAMWGTIFPSNATDFADAMNKAAVNVAAFRREIPGALSSVQDLTQGMDELAQHGVFATEQNMHKIVEFIDLTAMIAKSSTSTVNQVRQEFQALFEGNIRAGNSLLMLLKNMGVNTAEIRSQIKAGIDVTDNFNKIVDLLVKNVDKMKRAIWERDPTTAFERWHKSLLVIISDAVDMASSWSGASNLFAKTLTEHADRLLHNQRLTKKWALAIQNLAAGFGVVLDASQDWFEGLAEWLSKVKFKNLVKDFRRLGHALNQMAKAADPINQTLVPALDHLSKAIKKVNDALPPEVMTAGWTGIIVRWLTGNSKIAAVAAAIEASAEAISRLESKREKALAKDEELAKRFGGIGIPGIGLDSRSTQARIESIKDVLGKECKVQKEVAQKCAEETAGLVAKASRFRLPKDIQKEAENSLNGIVALFDKLVKNGKLDLAARILPQVKESINAQIVLISAEIKKVDHLYSEALKSHQKFTAQELKVLSTKLRANREDLQKQLKGISKAIPYEKLTERVNALTESFKNQKRALGSNKEAVKELAREYLSQIADIEQKYSGLLKGATKDRLESLKSQLKGIVASTDKTTKEVDRLWIRAMDRVQRSFADTFYDMFHGKLRSFKDIFREFLDDLERYWSETMAKMAASWLFGRGGTGGGFLSGVKSFLGSLFGGRVSFFSSGGGMSPSPLTFASVLGLGGNLFDIGKSIGAGISSALGFGNTGIGMSLTPAGMSQGFLTSEITQTSGYSNAAILGGQTGIPSSTFGGWLPYIQVGGQIFLGYNIASSLFHGNYGAAAVHTLALGGSLYGGPIGWGIAGLAELGLAIKHLFFHKRPKASYIGRLYEFTDYSSESGWGEPTVTEYRKEGSKAKKLRKGADDMADTVLSIMNSLTSTFKTLLSHIGKYGEQYATEFDSYLEALSKQYDPNYVYSAHHAAPGAAHMSFAYYIKSTTYKHDWKNVWKTAMDRLIKPIQEEGTKLLKEALDKTVTNSSVWQYFTDDFRDYLTKGLKEGIAGLNIDWGKIHKKKDLEAALKKMKMSAEEIADIEQHVEKVGKIIDSITESIALHGMPKGTQAAIRNLEQINAQFEQYAETLKANGIDLKKYTDLEKAHQLAIQDAVQAMSKAGISGSDLVKALKHVAKEMLKAGKTAQDVAAMYASATAAITQNIAQLQETPQTILQGLSSKYGIDFSKWTYPDWQKYFGKPIAQAQGVVRGLSDRYGINLFQYSPEDVRKWAKSNSLTKEQRQDVERLIPALETLHKYNQENLQDIYNLGVALKENDRIVKNLTDSINRMAHPENYTPEATIANLGEKYHVDLSQFNYSDWQKYVDSLGDLSKLPKEQLQDLYDLGVAYKQLEQQRKQDFEEAKAAYISGLQREISKYQAAQQKLQSTYDKARSAYISGLQKEISVKEEAINNVKQTIQSFENLSKSISDFQKELVTTNLSVPVRQQYLSARQQFESVVQGLFSGDQKKVQESLRNLPEVSREFLAASLKYNTDFSAYRQDFAKVMSTLNTSKSIAHVNKSIAEKSLDVLNAQKESLQDTLDTLQDKVLPLAQLRANYLEAKNALDNSAYPAMIAADQATLNTLTNKVLPLDQLRAKYLEAKNKLDKSTYPKLVSADKEKIKTLKSVDTHILDVSISLAKYSVAVAQGIDAAKKAAADAMQKAQAALAKAQAALAKAQAALAEAQAAARPAPSIGSGSGNGGGGVVYMPSNGGHFATGLPYVPKNDYPAYLDEGETVLTASTANELRRAGIPVRSDKETRELLLEIKEILLEIRNTNGDQNKINKKLYRIFDRVSQGEDYLMTKVA